MVDYSSSHFGWSCLFTGLSLVPAQGRYWAVSKDDLDEGVSLLCRKLTAFGLEPIWCEVVLEGLMVGIYRS